MSVDFRDGPLANSQNLRLQIRWLQDGVSYDISLLEASGSTTFAHSVEVSESQLGLGVDDDLSDSLALTFLLNRGNDECDWLANGILSNTVSGVEVVRLDNAVLDTDAAFYANPVYVGFSSLDTSNDTNISDMMIHQLKFSAVR